MAHSQRFLDLCNQARKVIKECSCDDVKQWQDAGQQFVLIDVREESEWKASHISDAVYMGRGIIERDLEVKYPDLDTRIVLYCGGGFRSALSAELINRMGYTDIISMDGGFREWKEKDYPISQ
ncbi:MAG: rhodanese-related sulfurtransferase [Moritella sp.]|jgi:rhodanese-related sulfurtransferase